MKYIDIHCHLDLEDYDNDREEVIERMKRLGVGAITIGTDLMSSKKALEIAENKKVVWACVGIHPTSPRPLSEEEGMVELEFEKLVQNPKVVALGECGLDFFRVDSENLEEERKRQTELFEKQIHLAIKYGKALMLHCRSGSEVDAGKDAYDEVLSILASYKRESGERLFGNAHFFAGNLSQAKRFLDLGFTMSFTGVSTFTRDYDEVIKYIPQNSIMTETDSPFVAPVPHRGKRNEPAFVIEVLKKLAEIRGEMEENLRLSVLQNAQKIFGLWQKGEIA
jgi:TatD DNase family protein